MSPSACGQTLDWAAVHDRLDASGATVGAHAGNGDNSAVFHERMLRLASRTRSDAGRVRAETWIVCSISGEDFAVRASSLSGIARIEHIAQPFRMAPGMLGVICHMGRLLTVLDTRVMLGFRDGAVAKAGDCVLLPAEVCGDVALRVDDASATVDLTETQISAAQCAYGTAEAHICGRTAAGVTLVDLTVLLTRTMRDLCIVDDIGVK